MKKVFFVALGVVILFGLSLATAFANAYMAGYQNTNFQALTTPVTDGRWTTTAEWTDAAVPPNLPSPPSFHWRQKWAWPGNIIQHFLVEFFTDNTNDTGDYLQLCYDRNANGGTAPQSDDIMIEYVGHRISGVSVYRGNGTGWVKFTGWTWGTDLFISESLTSTPLNASPHWVIELWLDKSKTEFDISGSGYQPWIRVAVFDASNVEAGVRSWPPSSANVPDNWGLETGTTENIPEPITIVAVVLLSAVALIVSFRFLRRRQGSRSLDSASVGKVSCTR